ncbi:MAG: hypothetical protein JNL28_12735 [Planctomycetes bacterium]|nr:hypothetical protein [Planctomycetota bacterium]
MHWIRIIAVPPGDPPEHIRSAWVGVVIPIAEGWPCSPQRHRVLVGSLNQPRGAFWRWWATHVKRREEMFGYMVDGISAIDALREQDPIAAHWWEERWLGVWPMPNMVFAAEACEILHEVPTDAHAGQDPTAAEQRKGIPPHTVFMDIERALEPILNNAGLQRIEHVHDPESPGRESVTYGAEAFRLRLLWDGMDQCFVLDADRWANEPANGTWVELARESYLNWMASPYWAKEVSERIRLVVEQFLASWNPT